MEPAVHTSHLRRVYTRRRGEPVVALEDLSLTIGRDEIHGLLGPNGAGKTTLVRITHGLQAVRGILDGAPTGHIMGLLGMEALVGAAWYAVAALSMERLVSVGRRDGSLDRAG